MSVTDALLNNWVQVGANWNDGTNTYAVFQVQSNVVGGGANTVTLHSTRSAQLDLVIGEYVGQNTATPVDVSATGTWASTAASIGPITSTGNNESIVAIAWMAAATACSAADGNIDLNANGTTTQGLIESRSLATAGAATASWTNGAGGGAGMVLAVHSTSTAAASMAGVAALGPGFGINNGIVQRIGRSEQLMSARPAAMKTAVINVSASGDNSIVSAVSGSQIRVHGILFTAHAAVNVTFYSGANSGGTALSGAIELTAAGSSIFLPPQDEPYYTTIISALFNIYTSSGVQLSGTIWYTVS